MLATGVRAEGTAVTTRAARRRGAGYTMEDVRAHLAGQSKDALVELLMSQAATDAWLRDRLLLETAGGRSGGVDLATFRAAIDRAVEPDDYEDYRPA
ncbi:MAG TPA: hypothetical protein VII16_12285, partial [Actinomycetes bacterium]